MDDSLGVCRRKKRKMRTHRNPLSRGEGLERAVQDGDQPMITGAEHSGAGHGMC